MWQDLKRSGGWRHKAVEEPQNTCEMFYFVCSLPTVISQYTYDTQDMSIENRLYSAGRRQLWHVSLLVCAQVIKWYGPTSYIGMREVR